MIARLARTVGKDGLVRFYVVFYSFVSCCHVGIWRGVFRHFRIASPAPRAFGIPCTNSP
jgi:hypothetical protein